MPFLAEISPVVLYFCDFVSMSFWKRARHFICRNMTLFIQGSSVQILVEISPVVLERRILKVSQCIAIFCYYLPLKKVCPFVSSNLNYLFFIILCVKLSWNWLSVLEKKKKILKTLPRDFYGRRTGDQKSLLELLA